MLEGKLLSAPADSVGLTWNVPRFRGDRQEKVEGIRVAGYRAWAQSDEWRV